MGYPQTNRLTTKNKSGPFVLPGGPNTIALKHKKVHITTGRARFIRNDSAALFSFKLSGNSNKTMSCNSNFSRNFELEFTLN